MRAAYATELDHQVLHALVAVGPCTAAGLSPQVGASRFAVTEVLRRLQKRGIVCSAGLSREAGPLCDQWVTLWVVSEP